MSEQKLTCSVCHAYLFEDDDVVYCPTCGAPHHRDCYNGIGHCAFEENHGTERQYKKPDLSEQPKEETPAVSANKMTCAICGESYDGGLPKCPKCGAPRVNPVNGAPFMKFDFLGGVPENTDLGEGVTAGQARRFVFSNTARYIPKFNAMKNGRKTSWNWFAFLFPCGWFLSRKMYAAGVISGLLSVCFLMFLFPYSSTIETVGAGAANYMEMMNAIANDVLKGNPAYFLFVAGGLLFAALHIICGIFGDKLYRDHAIDTISRINKESEDIDLDYRKKGGTNFFLFAVGIFAVMDLPGILFTLLFK